MQGKRGAKLWLSGKPAKDNYWPMPPDANIAALVRALNKLPFLYTHACCGGHIRTKQAVRALLVGGAGRRKLTDDGEFGCYSGAWVSFTINGSPESMEFVRELKHMVSLWDDASLETLPAGVRTFGLQMTAARGSPSIGNFTQACACERQANRRIARVGELAKRFTRRAK